MTNGFVAVELYNAVVREKLLLTRQPVQVDEPSGAMPGEYMHEWVEKDAVLFDLPAEEIIEAMARDNKLLHDKLKGLTQKRAVTREWVETTIRELENALEPAHAECILEERLLDTGIKTEGGQICEDEKEEQSPMDKETAGDMKYHALKDEGLLDKFGRRKE